MTTEISVQEQLTAAETHMNTQKDIVGALVASGEDFSQAAVTYSAAIAAYQSTLLRFNEGAIDQETSELGNAILALVQASRLEGLIQAPVESVYWTFTAGDDQNGPIMHCGINVKARAATTRKSSSTSSGESTGSRKTPTYTIDGGEAMSAKDFVLNHAPDEVLNNSLVKGEKPKWATKPSFLEDTQKHLEDQGHTVVRIEPVEEPAA